MHSLSLGILPILYEQVHRDETGLSRYTPFNPCTQYSQHVLTLRERLNQVLYELCLEAPQTKAPLLLYWEQTTEAQDTPLLE